MIGPNGMNAFCRSSGWKDCFTIASPWGIITAPKSPCRTRNAISAPAVGASPHSSEATVKPAMPMMNIRRRPTRSPARAEMTSPTAKDIVYAASTHCRVLGAAAEVGLDRRAGQVGDRGVEQVHDVGDDDDGHDHPAVLVAAGPRLRGFPVRAAGREWCER